MPTDEDGWANIMCGVNVGEKALQMLKTKTSTTLGPSVLSLSH